MWKQTELCGMLQRSCYLVSRISVHQSDSRFHLAMFDVKSKIKEFKHKYVLYIARSECLAQEGCYSSLQSIVSDDG